MGALARVLLLQVAPTVPGAWPWATFAANVAGTLLLGYCVTRLQERLPVSAYRRPLLGTGLCGAFTTFSTMQLEVLRMLGAGRPGRHLRAGQHQRWPAGGVLGDALVRRVRTLA